MAKTLLSKELFFIDLKTNTARFFALELISVGYNKIQMVSTHGNMNGKGRSSLKFFEGENSFSVSKKMFYSKTLELKAQGYYEKQDLEKWLSLFDEWRLKENVDLINENIESKKELRKKIKKEKDASFKCSSCGSKIKEETYHKINEWARGEGGWDKDKNFVGYQKVLCINCQIEHDIFKKKNDSK